MHQPNYFDPSTDEYILPWTYLHAIKDYVDMAAHLEDVPAAKAVINFAPILLEQLDDYAKQVAAFLREGKAIQDHLLSSLVSSTLPEEPEQRIILVKACLRANEGTIIKRFPCFQHLAEMAGRLMETPDDWRYVSDQYMADIVTWYHLGWMGETVRRRDPRIKALMEKGRCFSLHDRHELMTVISELLSGVLGRYRRLAENGQVELSFTPYAHPIMPLLLDIKSAHEAMPGAPLPLAESYPGGEARTEWHIEKGLQTFEHYFGVRPSGCWPSEGSVCMHTLKLLDEHGLRWAASGESVLRNSLNLEQTPQNLREHQDIHKPYLPEGQKISCFFRDDGLSDSIGFKYSNWHADDAVADFMHHLENIADAGADNSGKVVSIILDGENAWEYFPENAYYFLSALYSQLSANPKLQLTTFSECLDQAPASDELPHIVPGSWVYGSFSTWIGEQDKNRGWDMLVEAKRCFDSVVVSGRLNAEQLENAERQLGICEGSDWFWWFGDYNPSEAVRDFERLYRMQLATLYQMLGEEPPEHLSHAFTHGGGDPDAGGVMRQGQEA
ncbi:MAG TPA: glycoside hydrolase [Candidatus Tenderia electrophaga]|uniref:Glycoside hydrolase n=1 Tax=Candidatus Tenderia electrophaga TaxID=1748243 RepID=A0A832J814_9GAMM|nr:glycoside hydrolase [Candidatus Tenderia electrophaga]